MGIISNLLVLAAQVSEGLETRDWVVPAISGAAGVIGALGGQALSRRAQIGVEGIRGEREIEAEKRLARGIAAALMKSLEYQRSVLGSAERDTRWWPLERKMALDLPRQEQIALASWIGDPAWGIIVAPFMMLGELDAWRAWAASNGAPYEAGRFRGIEDAIDLAVGVLKEQIAGALSPAQPLPTNLRIV